MSDFTNGNVGFELRDVVSKWEFFETTVVVSQAIASFFTLVWMNNVLKLA